MLFGPTAVPKCLIAACKEAASHCELSTKIVPVPALESVKDAPSVLVAIIIASTASLAASSSALMSTAALEAFFTVTKKAPMLALVL